MLFVKISNLEIISQNLLMRYLYLLQQASTLFSYESFCHMARNLNCLIQLVVMVTRQHLDTALQVICAYDGKGHQGPSFFYLLSLVTWKKCNVFSHWAKPFPLKITYSKWASQDQYRTDLKTESHRVFMLCWLHVICVTALKWYHVMDLSVKMMWKTFENERFDKFYGLQVTLDTTIKPWPNLKLYHG